MFFLSSLFPSGISAIGYLDVTLYPNLKAFPIKIDINSNKISYSFFYICSWKFESIVKMNRSTLTSSVWVKRNLLQIELFLIESKGIAKFEKHFSFIQSVSLLRAREEDRAWEQGFSSLYIEHFCGRLEGPAILISRMLVCSQQ